MGGVLLVEVLVVLVLFDVAAWIESAVDRGDDEWSGLYWVQLGAAASAVAFTLYAVLANQELVEEAFVFLPHVMVLLVLLLPASLLILAYTATFTLGYWSYRSASTAAA